MPKPDARDVAAALGLLLLALGCYLIYPPLALLVPGAIITLKALI